MIIEVLLQKKMKRVRKEGSSRMATIVYLDEKTLGEIGMSQKAKVTFLSSILFTSCTIAGKEGLVDSNCSCSELGMNGRSLALSKAKSSLVPDCAHCFLTNWIYY